MPLVGPPGVLFSPVGKIGTFTANSQIARMPMKKNGIDHSTRLPCVSNVSVVLPRLPAAITPIQEPRKEDSTVATPPAAACWEARR